MAVAPEVFAALPQKDNRDWDATSIGWFGLRFHQPLGLLIFVGKPVIGESILTDELNQGVIGSPMVRRFRPDAHFRNLPGRV